MSRFRTRSEASARSMMISASGWGSQLFANAYPLGDPFGYLSCNRSSSRIQDDLTPHGAPRRVNVCEHFKNQATFVRGTQKFLGLYTNRVHLNQTSEAIDLPVLWTPSTLGLPDPDWSRYVNDLAGQLDGSIQDGTLLGVSIAESAKTVKMMLNPFGLMRKDWRKVISSLWKDKRYPSAHELTKGSANLWLEHRYGWNALYQDLKSFATTTAKVWTPSVVSKLSSLTERYSAGEQLNARLDVDYPVYGESLWNSDWNGSYPYGGPWGLWCRILPTGSVTYRVSCRQQYRQLNWLQKSFKMLHAYGLTAPDILSTLWEMTPYSFVVDWFINMKGLDTYMSSLRLGAADITNISYSKKFACEYHSEVKLKPPSWCDWSIWNPAYECVGARFCRSESPGSYVHYSRFAGLPPATSTSIFTNHGLSVTQTISGVALILQRFLR